jgi:hypothetical protein
MRKILTITAASMMITMAIPAFASGDDVSCGKSSGKQLSVQAITEKATGMGYDVRKVERDDGCYEVYAIDKKGARVEIYMNPVTGAVLKIKNKS